MPREECTTLAPAWHALLLTPHALLAARCVTGRPLAREALAC